MGEEPGFLALSAVSLHENAGTSICTAPLPRGTDDCKSSVNNRTLLEESDCGFSHISKCFNFLAEYAAGSVGFPAPQLPQNRRKLETLNCAQGAQMISIRSAVKSLARLLFTFATLN